MKRSKAHVESRVHARPVLKFDEHRLTSYAGLVVFQALFRSLDLKQRLHKCFKHVSKAASYGTHVIVMLLLVHQMLGYRYLRELEYYADDPMLCRLLGLRCLPDVSTISRRLGALGQRAVDGYRRLLREIVMERVRVEALVRLTLDFDGSVLSTRRHAEGTAVGYNKQRKGARSYYPLFCTVAQTGQFLDLHHRPGNVHDSNGAVRFARGCFAEVREYCPNIQLESRMDSAFFNESLLHSYEEEGVEFSATVPFERFPILKSLIETCDSWESVDDEWFVTEFDWAPKSWTVDTFRFIGVRRRVRLRHKGPLQLDLFEPIEHEYQYKVIVTNKSLTPAYLLEFHNGRGGQEGIIGEAKSCTALDRVPMRRKHANQIHCISSMLAHNLGRELQMSAHEREPGNNRKRSPLWTFATLRTLVRRIIQRAGRLTRPRGILTLSLSGNEAVRNELTTYLDAFDASPPGDAPTSE